MPDPHERLSGTDGLIATVVPGYIVSIGSGESRPRRRRSLMANVTGGATWITWIIVASVLATGCSSLGPGALHESRLQYNETVKASSEEELLLNIVRLRYTDTPSSLAVSAIAAQYELTKNFQLTPFFVASGAEVAKSYAAVLPQLGIAGADRPTFTLTPLDDQEFTRKLFTPVPLDGILYLAKTTWPIATVFRLYLENLNWVPNAQTASGPTPKLSPAYEEFLRGVRAMQVLQNRGQLVFGVEERSEAQGSPLPAGSVTARDMVEAAKSGYEYRLDERGTAWTLFKKTPQPVLLLFGEELEHGRFEDDVVPNPHPHEAGRPQRLGPVRDAVELVSAQVAPPRDHHADDGLAGKGVEGAPGEHSAAVGQLHRKAGVRLVGAVAAHGLGPGEAGEGFRPLAGDGLDPAGHGLLDEAEDVLLVDEGGLHVELGELELAVGAEVLVPPAAGHLVVAVDARHHQQLLEQLGGLGQGEERSRHQPGGHEEVAGALGGRAGQGGGFHVDEAGGVHGRPQGRHQPGANLEVLRHLRPAQVEVAVAQPEVLVDLDALVEREGRRLGLVEDLEAGGGDLHLTGGQVGIDRALGPGAHRALHPDHVLRPEPVGLGAAGGGRVEHDLDETFPVAQVDEDNPAMIPTVGHPAAQGDLRPLVGSPERAGVAGAQAHVPSRSRCSQSQETTRERPTSTCSPDSMSRTATAPLPISSRPTITR